jgi:hypothetical protein
MVIYTKKCPFTGQMNSMEIPMNQRAFDKALKSWKEGKLIQDSFPNLTPEQREFIKTGITPRMWDEIFSEEEDESDSQHDYYGDVDELSF